MLLYCCAAVYLGINYRSVNRTINFRPAPSVSVVKPYLPQGEGSILSDVSSGPEIIWFLEEKVIGTPYHRNVEGIEDGILALHHPDPEVSLSLLKKHRVKAVLLLTEMEGMPLFFYDMNQRYSYQRKDVHPNTLFRKLFFSKNLPCGITEELNTPAPYLLYTVDFSKCPDE